MLPRVTLARLSWIALLWGGSPGLLCLVDLIMGLSWVALSDCSLEWLSWIALLDCSLGLLSWIALPDCSLGWLCCALLDCSLGLLSLVALLKGFPRLLSGIALPRLLFQITLVDCSPRLLSCFTFLDCFPRLLSCIALLYCSPVLLPALPSGIAAWLSPGLAASPCSGSRAEVHCCLL